MAAIEIIVNSSVMQGGFSSIKFRFYSLCYAKHSVPIRELTEGRTHEAQLIQSVHTIGNLTVLLFVFCVEKRCF